MYNEPVPRSQRVATCLLLGAGLTWVQGAVAQAASSTSSPDTWLDQATMTGDWGGARSDLESLGISPRGDFTSESAGNTSGGEEQTARSTEQIDFGADFALQRLLHIPNAKIQLTMTDRFGRSLSADAIGNQFAVQELYGAGQKFRLAELNYQQDFLEHQLAIEVGWSPLGDRFVGISAFCNFQNGIICGHNNAMTNNSGAHNFPTAEWGARIKLQATPDFYAMGGVYQVNPNEGDADNGSRSKFPRHRNHRAGRSGLDDRHGQRSITGRPPNRGLLQYLHFAGRIHRCQWTSRRSDRQALRAT